MALAVDVMVMVLELVQPPELVVVSVKVYTEEQQGFVTTTLAPVVEPVITALPQWS